ncbi:MAG: hypothetical protein H6598_10245 [Flavobacteriales bacterium]|nr:hypothetical protein [Flavobacteriales bacterium]
MRLIILLRKDSNINLFRDILIDSIASAEGDECYLGSGFFQELKITKKKTGIYKASMETSNSGNRLCCSLAKNNVKITTIGVHNSYWVHPYAQFCSSLYHHGISLTSYLFRNSWHAKTFVLLKEGTPILGIIGSSNITRPAFSSGGKFNYEADVVMWDSSNSKLNGLMNTVIETNENPFGLIVTDYDPDKNKGITIDDRLKGIVDEIQDLFKDSDEFDFEAELKK